ncbi:MAG: NAD(P)H-dependent oxidoreductase [Pseudomonadota bacterium]
MHVLTVLDHPDPNSFTRAAAEAFGAGAEAAGHQVELDDLHAEGFDPRWSVPDLAQFEDQPMPNDVLAEQAKIDRADVVCMVFPLFWWGMPAMSKGWIDRVWSWGWAYDQVDAPDISLQRPRTGVFLVPAGAAPDSMSKYDYDKAVKAIWLTGTMGYLGFKRKQVEVLHGSTGSEERRKGLLDRAWRIGHDLQPPE